MAVVRIFSAFVDIGAVEPSTTSLAIVSEWAEARLAGARKVALVVEAVRVCVAIVRTGRTFIYIRAQQAVTIEPRGCLATAIVPKHVRDAR